MKTLVSSLFALILIGALFTGCNKTTVNTVERSQSYASPSVINDKRIVTDKGLDKAIDILQVSEGTVSGNILKVQVILGNNGSKPTNVNYAFEWFDESGMLVTGLSSSWKSIRLMGKETKPLTAIAPSPRVVDFVLKLQEPTIKKNK